MSNEKESGLDDFDVYGQLVLKTIITVSIGASAFILATMGTLFSKLYDPDNQTIAYKALEIMDKPFDQFIIAAISAMISLGFTYMSLMGIYFQKKFDNKILSYIAVVLSTVCLTFGFSGLFYCIMGLHEMTQGVEEVLKVLQLNQK